MGALYDLVAFSTTTTGTGTITAGSALSNLLPLSSVPDGTPMSYSIKSGSGQYETGVGAVGGSGTTLTRGLRTSTTGSLLNLSGTSEVRCSPNAGDFPPSTEVATFADLIALSGVPTGRVYTVLGPVVTGGLPGIQFAKTSTGWTPAGDQVIYTLPSPVAGVTGGVASTTQMLGVAQLAVGLLRNVSRLVVTAKFNFSAADVNLRQLSVRVGNSTTVPSGSGGEMAIGSNVAAAARQASFGREVWFPTETTFQHADANAYGSANIINLATNNDPYQGFSTPNQTTGQVVLQACAFQGASPAATVTLQAFEVRIR